MKEDISLCEAAKDKAELPLLPAERSQRGKIIVDDFLEIDFAKCELL